MRAEIERVARKPFNILITGETGTGKTYAARKIHRLSERANNPFTELNSANLPEPLVEAELFGYRKGASLEQIATTSDSWKKLTAGFSS